MKQRPRARGPPKRLACLRACATASEEPGLVSEGRTACAMVGGAEMRG